MSITNEEVIETKQCKLCSTQFEITDKDLNFYDKVSPIFNGKKYSIPAPTFCPDCRQQRRLGFRNERKFYKRTCDITGEDIISSYSPDKNYKVFNKKVWDSDRYSPTDYGIEFDFNKTFFEQFNTLFENTPKPHLYQEGDMTNSEYTNFTGWLKDCYLVSDSGKSENCFYGNLNIYSKTCIDCSSIINSELCYEVINSYNCNKLYFSKYCIDCNNSSFLDNCVGCENCFGCKNLNNKSYCFLNEQLTKQDYLEKVSQIKNYQDYSQQVRTNSLNNVDKNLRITNSNNSFGDILDNCNNADNCYECFAIENSKFCQNTGNNVHSCYDISAFGENMELCYELSASGGVKGKTAIYGCLFGAYCFYGGSDLLYCIGAHGNSKNCFGCTSLKSNQYCILNKQYTKEEYNLLVPQIINHMKATGEWGEFFPSNISPFGYNETLAQEYFPLEKENVIKNNFNWSDYETPFPKVDKIIPANKLPDNISDIPDDILNWAIECDMTKKPFKITPQELEFYRKNNLPIPKKHPDQRHLDRVKLRNPRKLFERDCDKCGTQMQTTYTPDREETVYCEECYNKEVY